MYSQLLTLFFPENINTQMLVSGLITEGKKGYNLWFNVLHFFIFQVYTTNEWLYGKEEEKSR